MNAYPNQKVGATDSSSGTTSSPPLSSIFHRGECTLDVMLGIYWKFSEACDYYLVRILSILDPCITYFGVLPPHSTIPSDDPRVEEALNLRFLKTIYIETERTSDRNTFFKNLLSRWLA